MTMTLTLILLVLFFSVCCLGIESRNITKPQTRAQTELRSEVIYLTKANPVAYVESPGYPDQLYPNNIQKQYHIEVRLPEYVSKESARILVSFETFLLESSVFCYKDGLDVADQKGQIRVFCGPQAGRTFLSDENVLRMRMFTDTENQDRGFRIKVQLYESSCSKVIRTSGSGVITSPNYPYKYGGHELCIWRIEAPRGMIVRLKFNGKFDIKSDDEQCLRDYLEISQTGNFETHIQRLCGNLRPTTLNSQGNSFMLRFFSDCCGHGYGFKAEYAVLPAESTTTARPVTPPNYCDCGRSNEGLRIVGGGEAPEHRYPWMVALVNEEGFLFGGATLIGPRHILTAAHCCERRPLRNIRVVLGAHDLRDGPSSLPVMSCTMHPSYQKTNYVNDIAVITLYRPIMFDDFVRPICINFEDNSMENEMAVTAGWGRVREAGDDSPVLKEAELPIVSNAQCYKKYGPIIRETNICAGGQQNDACQGDSGGPLQYRDGSIWTQIGVVSTGIGCGRPAYPGIYTRVSKYRDFIRNVTLDNWCAPPIG